MPKYSTDNDEGFNNEQQTEGSQNELDTDDQLIVKCENDLGFEKYGINKPKRITIRAEILHGKGKKRKSKN